LKIGVAEVRWFDFFCHESRCASGREFNIRFLKHYQWTVIGENHRLPLPPSHPLYDGLAMRLIRNGGHGPPYFATERQVAGNDGRGREVTNGKKDFSLRSK